MDLKEAVRVVEMFEERWKEIPKGVVVTEMLNHGKRRFSTACEYRSLRIIFGLVVGPKGGTSQHVTIIDTSKRVVAERLVAHEVVTEDYYANAVDLEMVRQRLRDREDLRTVARDAILEGIASFNEDPAAFLRAAVREHFEIPEVVN